MGRRKGPAPKKCTAKSRQTGKRCAQWARPGWDVCVYHGAGKASTRDGGRPIVHGRYSMRLRGISEKNASRLEQLEGDDSLFDLRRTVAASQLAIESMLFELDDGMVDVLARRRANLPDNATPTEADREAVRRDWAEVVQRQLDRHGKMQAQAARSEAAVDVMLKAAAPIMRSFSQRVSEQIREFLPPSRADEFDKRMATLLAASVAEMRALQDDL